MAVETTKDWLIKIFGSTIGQIPVLNKTVEEAAEFLTSLVKGGIDGVSEAVDFLINAVSALCDDWRRQGKINPLSFFGLSTLEGGSTECFVNVYGEDDVLKKLGVGGKMDYAAGFSGPDQLFNVEIKSLFGADGKKIGVADHYIYMRDTRDYSFDTSEEAQKMALQREYDERVSAFVADLLIASKSKISIKDFLDNDRRIKWNSGEHTYEVYPLGAPQQ